MREITFEIPKNTFTLTDAEINLIHAMACYFAVGSAEDNGMTKQSYKLVKKMEEQFGNIRTEKDFQVWE
jgi:hypothetical protein